MLSPVITDEIVIMVVTPMTIPRIVSPERSLFVLRVSRAILTDSRVCPCAIPRPAFLGSLANIMRLESHVQKRPASQERNKSQSLTAGLLVPQRLNRIQVRRLPRRINPKYQPNAA